MDLVWVKLLATTLHRGADCFIQEAKVTEVEEGARITLSLSAPFSKDMLAALRTISRVASSAHGYRSKVRATNQRIELEVLPVASSAASSEAKKARASADGSSELANPSARKNQESKL